jgi:uncharacterized protein YggE
MQWMRAAAVFAVMAAASPQMATAQEAQVAVPAVQGTLLSVSAEGKSTGRPDMATLNLGVTTEAPSAQAALQANATRMNTLIAALRRAGVAERDIQTSNVSVNPQQVYQEGQPPRITGYQANNTVTAKVRRIDNTGRVIDAAVAAGGNTINGVFFSYQDPDAQLDAARRDAIREARRRADLYANALNMHVVRIVAVNEGGGYTPPVPMPMAREMAVARDSTPVQPGEVDTTVNVGVTFELRQSAAAGAGARAPAALSLRRRRVLIGWRGRFDRRGALILVRGRRRLRRRRWRQVHVWRIDVHVRHAEIQLRRPLLRLKAARIGDNANSDNRHQDDAREKRDPT